MNTLENYVITLETFGRFEIADENIFHALDNIKELILKDQSNKLNSLKATQLHIVSAFIISNNNIIEITDYI